MKTTIQGCLAAVLSIVLVLLHSHVRHVAADATPLIRQEPAGTQAQHVGALRCRFGSKGAIRTGANDTSRPCRILFVTGPMAAHVKLAVAVGSQLASRGYDVTVATQRYSVRNESGALIEDVDNPGGDKSFGAHQDSRVRVVSVGLFPHGAGFLGDMMVNYTTMRIFGAAQVAQLMGLLHMMREMAYSNMAAYNQFAAAIRQGTLPIPDIVINEPQTIASGYALATELHVQLIHMCVTPDTPFNSERTFADVPYPLAYQRQRSLMQRVLHVLTHVAMATGDVVIGVAVASGITSAPMGRLWCPEQPFPRPRLLEGMWGIGTRIPTFVVGTSGLLPARSTKPMMRFVGALAQRRPEPIGVETALWLDRQSDSSVVYVSFGTLIPPTAALVQALVDAFVQLASPCGETPPQPSHPPPSKGDSQTMDCSSSTSCAAFSCCGHSPHCGCGKLSVLWSMSTKLQRRFDMDSLVAEAVARAGKCVPPVNSTCDGRARQCTTVPDGESDDTTTDGLCVDEGRLEFRVEPWVQQASVLSHRAIAVAVMHAGINGMLEAYEHGVGTVALPGFCDRFRMAGLAQAAGASETVLRVDATATTLANALAKVACDASYSTAARRVSALMKLGGGAPAAADLVEEVLEFGTDHLRAGMDDASSFGGALFANEPGCCCQPPHSPDARVAGAASGTNSKCSACDHSRAPHAWVVDSRGCVSVPVAVYLVAVGIFDTFVQRYMFDAWCVIVGFLVLTWLCACGTGNR